MEDGPWVGDPDNPIALVWGEEVAPELRRKREKKNQQPTSEMYEEALEEQDHDEMVFDIISYMKDNDDYNLDHACRDAGISKKRLTRGDIKYIEEETNENYLSDISSIVNYMIVYDDYNLDNACEGCDIPRSRLSKRDIAEIEDELDQEIEL